MQKTAAVVHESANDLHGSGLFVGNGVQLALEGQDLCAGVSQQDRGVGGDDELGVLVAAQGLVDEKKARELALWGERGLGLVEEEETARGDLGRMGDRETCGGGGEICALGGAEVAFFRRGEAGRWWT